MQSCQVLICKFCEKTCKNKNSHTNHQRLCKFNPERQFTHITSEYNKNRKPTNQFIKAKELGFENLKMKEETKRKISITNTNFIWSDERKISHSLKMKEVVLKNPSSYSKSNRGRVKHIKKYNLTFDGSWELIFYEWCLKNNVDINDNLDFFEYQYKDNSHLYNPDFYLPSLDFYVEVKGYYDDKDISKWQHFNKNIFILDKNYINLINKGTFTLQYIKNNKKDFII